MMPLHVCNGLVGIRVHVGLGHQANGTSAAHVKFNCVCEQLISLCNSERIIKIGQYLWQLRSNEKGSSFLTRSTTCYSCWASFGANNVKFVVYLFVQPRGSVAVFTFCLQYCNTVGQEVCWVCTNPPAFSTYFLGGCVPLEPSLEVCSPAYWGAVLSLGKLGRLWQEGHLA